MSNSDEENNKIIPTGSDAPNHQQWDNLYCIARFYYCIDNCLKRLNELFDIVTKALSGLQVLVEGEIREPE